MDLSVLNTYLPTLIRYALVAVGLGLIMLVVYRVQLLL